MPCGCIPIIVDPPNPSTNCLIARDLRFRCDQGPDPCGGVDGTLTVDLAQYNDVTACTGVVTYSLDSFDAVGLQNVTVSAAGVVSAETTNVFKDHKEYKIQYRVKCSNSILSSIGIIYVCMRNPCGICPPNTSCNPCTGLCDAPPDEILIHNINEIVVL